MSKAEAWNLATALGISLQKAMGIMGLAGAAAKPKLGFGLDGIKDPIMGGAKELTFGDAPGNGTRDPNFNPYVPPALKTPSGGGKGGGGGAAAIDKEKDALSKLIAEQQRQIDMLRVTDPIQQEIMRNHEALANATEAERAQVIELIKERMRLEEIKSNIEELGQTGEQAFKGLVFSAHGFGDALGMVADKLADMMASSAWDVLWNGMDGGGGFGGLLDGLFGLGGGGGTGSLGLPMPFADGGRIGGSGGGREDNHLIFASTGEFMVNAPATSEHLPLLEAINNGASISDLMAFIGGHRPRFADGGSIAAITGSSAPSSWRRAYGGDQASGGSNPIGSSQSASIEVRVSVDKDGNLKAMVQQEAQGIAVKVMGEAVEQFSSNILPGRVAEISRDPLVRGA